MIKSFRSKALERLYSTGSPRGLRTDLVAKIERVLVFRFSDGDAYDVELTDYH